MHFQTLTSRFPIAIAALAISGSSAAWAGSETVPPRLSHFDGQSNATTVSSAPAAEYVILHRPYLKISGPTALRFGASNEPLVRRPPAMAAVRKAPKEDPSLAKAQPEPKPERTIISTLLEPVLPAAPSVFNGDQQSTTLPPVAAPSPTPAAAAPSGPLPDALSNNGATPNDLSTALPYFEAPTANGGQISLPVPPSILEPTPGAPLPPSSATYEVK